MSDEQTLNQEPETINAKLEKRHLAFERQQWATEVRFREQEIQLKRQELMRSRWSNPLVLAILGAALATAGNAVVTWMNGRAQRKLDDDKAGATLKLEKYKSESSRILEVIRTADPDTAAKNLQFLIDTGLVSETDTVKSLNKYLTSRVPGAGAELPSAVTPPSLTGEVLAPLSGPRNINSTNLFVSPSQRVVAACEANWEAHKSDGAAFVQAVAQAIGIVVEGKSADDMIDEMRSGGGWQPVPDGVAARDLAGKGFFVVAGLKGTEQVTPSPLGHVAIVVDGPLDSTGKYPSAYWGRLGGVGQKFATLNWAWRAGDRERVNYFARPIAPGR